MQKTSKHITIVTDFNDNLGSGHIQRMSSLMSYIHYNTDYKISMVCKDTPSFLAAELQKNITNNIQGNTSLIIRDMRDSRDEDISKLQNHGPVLVIDDMGPGREIADFAWDILPNPQSGNYRKNLFIYGYSFMSDIKNLSIKERDIDFSVYIGMNPSKKEIEYVLSLLPEGSITAFLMGEKSLIFTGYNFSKLDMNPLQAMARSHSLITHFGLTMYEGLLMKLNVFTLNPSKYHSDLCNMIINDNPIINLGTFENTINGAENCIAEHHHEKKESINTTDISHTSEEQCKNFIHALKNEICL
jgi:spore coat polysaccharide biosynthesis predicted glycosyltransferase SpsG